MSHRRRGLWLVEVKVVDDPDGNRAVLLQLPDGFMVMKPDDALKVAGALLDAADEAGATA